MQPDRPPTERPDPERAPSGRPRSESSPDANQNARGRKTAVGLVPLLGATIVLTVACQTPGPTSGPVDSSRARVLLGEGLELYDAGEFTRAAMRFHEAAEGLRAAGQRERARDAVAAECASWLRARQLRQLDDCTKHLASVVRRSRKSDPGVNTLIALGAVAGERPLPPYRLPSRVQPLIRAAASAAEGGR